MRKFKSETIVARLFSAVSNRVQQLRDSNINVPSEFTKKNGILDNLNPEGNSYRSFLHAVEQTKAVFDFEPLMNCIGNLKTGANDANYLQAKTIEKVIKFVKAFGNRDLRMLDNHTRCITINTLHNNGCISSLAAFATLTKIDSEEISEVLKQRNNYTAGTGSSQLGSTRELFRIMGITNGTKGAKQEAIVFTDEAKTAFVQFFEPLAKFATAADADDVADQDELAEAA